MRARSTQSRERVKGQSNCVPHKHAHTVCSSDQLNREKGSPEGRRPFGRVKGQRPLRSPINTRILYAVATNSIAKKGVQRVEDPLAGSRGSALGFPNQHAGAVCSRAQLNRAKGSPEGRRPFGGVKGQRPLRLSIVPAFFARIKGKKQKDVDKFHRNGYDREDNRIIRDGSCGRGLHG